MTLETRVLHVQAAARQLAGRGRADGGSFTLG